MTIKHEFKEIVNVKDADGKAGIMHAVEDDKVNMVKEILNSPIRSQ